MFGMEELKERIEVEGDTVNCPVVGCGTLLTRMARGTPKSLDAYLERGAVKGGEQFDQFLCKEHGIYITPTTFIYRDLQDNLLWHEDVDRDLLDRILAAKRSSAQLHHENSEDAVTWNVFRFMDSQKLLSGFLAGLCSSPVTNPEMVYWSYSDSQRDVWDELARAREEFGERPQQASEPDLIVPSDGALFVIEAKMKAACTGDFNRNHTAEEKEERIGRYSRGDRFLRQSVGGVIDAGYYQLMRFWVIGCSLAERLGLDFYLVCLVLSVRELGIEHYFKKLIKEEQGRRFMRITWEDVYEYMVQSDLLSKDWEIMSRYFANKTLDGKRAFSIS
ncbi:MAG: hypothetical protein CEE40_07875 [Chloroflexi bacterium B3_Chlor]|nr:MAG: hypothetical protein CEE40_07875 [Chloroflexi bacterium B3_Chlor]